LVLDRRYPVTTFLFLSSKEEKSTHFKKIVTTRTEDEKAAIIVQVFPIDRVALLAVWFLLFPSLGFTTIKDPFHGLWAILPFEWKVICNHQHPP
jgi:hypothetical protein